MSRKINIFACGGFGQNVVLSFLKRESFGLLQEHIKLFALDTSSANLRKYMDNGLDKLISCHLVPRADGSGAFRGENIEAIVAMVGDLVNSHEIPEGLCLILSSASGGSGAVIAAELHHNLSKRGRSVVNMLLETDEDLTRVENTLKTVKTFQHKASQGRHHLTGYWRNNRDENDRVNKAAANEDFITVLENLIMIGHPEVEALDTKDTYNWLQHPRNSESGEMRFLKVRFRGENEFFPTEEDVPLSILSLVSDVAVDQDLPRGVSYSTHGILPKSVDFGDGRVETQFCIYGGRAAARANSLETTIKEYAKIRQADDERRSGNEIRRSASDVISDDGQFI